MGGPNVGGDCRSGPGRDDSGDRLGGGGTDADLIALRSTGVIAGAISGRALYDGAIDLAQAIAALKG